MSSRKAGFVFFFSILLSFAYAFLQPYAAFVWPGVTGLVPSIVISEGALLVPTVIFLLCTPAEINECLGYHKIRISTALWAVLLVVTLMPAVTAINFATQLISGNGALEIAQMGLDLPAWAVFLMVGVLGPIAEEFVFRGYIFHSFRRTGRIAGSVILSAVMFGLMHLNFNQACYACFLGIMLALAVEATGSTVTSTIMHMLFNSFSVAAMTASGMFSGDFTEEEINAMQDEIQQMFGSGSASYMIAAIGMLACVGAAFLVLSGLILNQMAAGEHRPPVIGRKKGSRQTSAGPTGQPHPYGAPQSPQGPSQSAAGAQPYPYGIQPYPYSAQPFPQGPSQPVKKPRLLSVPAIVGMVICVVYIVLAEFVFA